MSDVVENVGLAIAGSLEYYEQTAGLYKAKARSAIAALVDGELDEKGLNDAYQTYIWNMKNLGSEIELFREAIRAYLTALKTPNNATDGEI